MKNYKNKIFLRCETDNNVDAIIFTNEATETIEKELMQIISKFYREEICYSELKFITEELEKKFDVCIIDLLSNTEELFY